MFAIARCMQNTSVVTMLARIEAICKPLPVELLAAGKHSHHFYTRSCALYERDAASGHITLLKPKATPLASVLGVATSAPCLAFLRTLLQPNPKERPTAAGALEHPWLTGS